MLVDLAPEAVLSEVYDFDQPLPLPPTRPDSKATTGLNQGMLVDLVLKAFYYNKQMSGTEVSAHLCLPFETVIRPIVEQLRLDALLVSIGAIGARTSQTYYGNIRYELSEAGIDRAVHSVSQCTYCGPAPVPVDQYIQACQQQTIRQAPVNPERVEEAMAGLTFPADFMHALGPAVNSARSLFLYGSPGNGKSTLAKAIGNMLGDPVWIPYCLEVGGQIVRLLDKTVHKICKQPEEELYRGDGRWVLVKRPVITAAGEMTISSLDLHFDEASRTYEAPLHVKANNGVLVIDDLGRQQVSPKQLLNRWIYPLEHRIDYLTLRTGRQLAVPFDVFVIFATNLEPKDLADEAFLRRIRHKLEVPNPTEAEFRKIFSDECAQRGLGYRDEMVTLLIKEFYLPTHRSIRGSHARDILDHAMDIIAYRNMPPAITPEILRLSAKTYFVHSIYEQGRRPIASWCARMP